MEKKFEQLDHFEKVVTYARQGYGGMTISVKGGTSKEDQREAWYQARKKFNDIRLELPDGVIGPIFNDEYGDVTALLYAVKGDGIGQAELSDVGRGHQAAPAQGADGEEGRPLRQAGEEGVRRVLAPAPRGARHHARRHRREPAQPEQRARERLDRHAGRPRPRARDRPVRHRGRHPQRADLGRRPHDQARRLRHRHGADSRIRRATPCATTASRCSCSAS